VQIAGNFPALSHFVFFGFFGARCTPAQKFFFWRYQIDILSVTCKELDGTHFLQEIVRFEKKWYRQNDLYRWISLLISLFSKHLCFLNNWYFPAAGRKVLILLREKYTLFFCTRDVFRIFLGHPLQRHTVQDFPTIESQFFAKNQIFMKKSGYF